MGNIQNRKYPKNLSMNKFIYGINQFSVTISLRNKSKMVGRISTIPSLILERRANM